MSRDLALLEALKGSITSGRFVDTKIYLFSQRNAAGEVCKPKVLYANSGVLRSVPYFDACAFVSNGPRFSCSYSKSQPVFSGNYFEAATRDLDGEIEDDDVIAEHYDYGSDSDLEDAEDPKPTEEPPLRGHLFDPFCFTSAEGGDPGPESNDDGTADDKPEETIWYFWTPCTSWFVLTLD